MTTKERLHQLIEETPEGELPAVLAGLFYHLLRLVVSDKDVMSALAQHPDLARSYIMGSPKWRQDIQEAMAEFQAGKGVRATDFFASLPK